MEIDGEEWLFYKAFPITVAFLRGTTADSRRQRHDGARGADARQSGAGDGGAELRRLRHRAGRAHRRAGALNPRQVQIPGMLVDCVVVAPARAPHADLRAPPTARPSPASSACRSTRCAPLPLDERKLIARRCAFELPMGGVVNLGIGMPEGVAAVANEEKVLSHVTLTAEPGVIGGVPQAGSISARRSTPTPIIHQNQQFDFYDGGGLDMACLGMAQVDADGQRQRQPLRRRGSPAPAASSTSARTRGAWCSPAPSPPAGSRSQVDDGELQDRARRAASASSSRQVEQITFNGAYAAEQRPAGALRHRALRVPARPRRAWS